MLRRLVAPIIAVAALLAAPAAASAQEPSPAPECSEGVAESALDATTILDAPLARWWGEGSGEFDLMTTFVVDKIWCRDLTGDGVREMTVNLICCTVTSPRPVVVFAVREGEWEAVHALSGLGRHWIWSPRMKGRQLHFRSPIYRRSDANCCPSGGYRKYRLVYDRGRFQLRRG